MPIDTSIYTLLRPSTIRGLDPFVEGRASGLQFRRDLEAAQEEEAARARAEQLRQAYRQQYGEAPGGLAGPAPAAGMAPQLGDVPVEERQLGGQPTTAFPSAPQGLPMQAPSGPPPPGPYSQTMQAPSGPPPPGPYGQTLEDRAGQPVGPASQTMGAGGLGSQSPSQNPFIRKLYTIDPAAGREAEKHAYDSRTLELAQATERVEYLGRVADGVLDVGTQEAHNIARAQLIQDGMPANQIPVAYDPQLWTMFSGMARTAAERLAQGTLQLNLDKYQYDLRKELRQVPDYGLGVDGNRLMHARYGDQLAPGQMPTPAMAQQIEKDLQEGKVAVSEATGARGAQEKALGMTAQKRLEALDTAGLAAQTTHTTLDEADRLIGEGVYGNSPADRGWMKLYETGVNQNDTTGQRTARLREIGNELILAFSQGGLGAAVSEEDARIYARAAGNFQQAKNKQEMLESIKSMRTILNHAVDYANKTRTHYEQTGTLPPFEGRAQPQGGVPGTAGQGGTAPSGTGAKRTTRAQIQGKLKPGWTIDQAVEYYRTQGYEVTP